MSGLVILAAAVFEISRGKNRQTDRRTDRQTQLKTLRYPATTGDVDNNWNNSNRLLTFS